MVAEEMCLAGSRSELPFFLAATVSLVVLDVQLRSDAVAISASGWLLGNDDSSLESAEAEIAVE